MSERSVVICGIARDCASSLRNLVPQIERLGSRFSSYSVIPVENNSRDDTRDVLEDWGARNQRVTPICFTAKEVREKRRKSEWFSAERVQRICTARNRYMEEIESHRADYVMIIDLDIFDFSLNGLASSFFHRENWHISAANGRRYTLRSPVSGMVYWDTYAFEPIEGYPGGTLTLKDLRRCQRDLAKSLASGRSLPALSAFGGLAIYRHEGLRGLRYRVVRNDDPDIPVLCEHVVLHRDMKSRNPQTELLIHPGQLVRYEPLATTLLRTLGMSR